MSSYHGPRSLRAGDIISEFDCGHDGLNRWLRGWARHNEARGGSRTFVSVTKDTGRVAGYYCLAASSLVRKDAPAALSRNMPDPIPVVLIGRLAVDVRHAGNGLGSSLLEHAVLQSIRVADTIGMRAIIVHAKDDRAVGFYERFGFTPFPDGSTRVLYLRASDAVRTVTKFDQQG
ncbi:GNAT family N-acetyltransferase [Leifsonia sp. F6_8S_P_1B]|uniref:GNAT family N-acetyltransferase n=1 Tax=Leifsonia williamsii TaxID=3035919 RepID=A0ABT8K8X4_9MICO|nr:GNAT family N-acetyltransferase [Leifsonia williamsii]MDN4612947.1 GNAT family N-acetyltransferase [Leifsonia williamsii]